MSSAGKEPTHSGGLLIGGTQMANVTGTAAAQKAAKALMANMIANRECLKCMTGTAVEGKLACQVCIDAQAEWNRREAAMLAALAVKVGA